MNLESELFTLQDSNSKLVAALHEANANVEQWKKQLVAYQEETERLRDQVRPPAVFSPVNVRLRFNPSPRSTCRADSILLLFTNDVSCAGRRLLKALIKHASG